MVLIKFLIFVCILEQIYCIPNYNIPYQPAAVNYPHPVPHPVIYNNVRQNIHPPVPRLNVHPPVPRLNVHPPVPRLNVHPPIPRLNVHPPIPRLNVHPPIPQYQPPPPIYHLNRPNYQPQMPPFVQQTYSPVQQLPNLPQPPPPPHLVHHRIQQTTCIAHPKYPANQCPQVYPEVTPQCYQTTNVRICTKQSSQVAVSTPAPTRVYETPSPQPVTIPPTRPTTNYINTNVAPSYPATSNNDIKPILKIVNTYTNTKPALQVCTTSTPPPPIVICKTTSTTTPYPQVPTMPDNTPSPYPSIPSCDPNPYSDPAKIKQKDYKPCRNPYGSNCQYDPYMNMPYYDDYSQYPPPYYYNSNEAEYMRPKSGYFDKRKYKDISCSDKKNKLKSVTIIDVPEKEKKFVYEKPIPITYPPIPTYSPSVPTFSPPISTYSPPTKTKLPSIYNTGRYYPTEEPKYPCDSQAVNFIPMKVLKKQDSSGSYSSKIKKIKIVKNSPKKCPKMKLKRKNSSSSSSSSESSSSCQRVNYGYGKIDTQSINAELSKRRNLGHPVVNPYDFKPFDDVKQKSKTDSSIASDSKRAAEIKHEENMSQEVNNNKFQEEMNLKANQRASQSQENAFVKTSEDIAEISN